MITKLIKKSKAPFLGVGGECALASFSVQAKKALVVSKMCINLVNIHKSLIALQLIERNATTYPIQVMN
jgi:hypothetical protein